MSDDMQGTRREDEGKGGEVNWLSIIVRFIVAAIVLMVTSLITPGFSNMTFGTAIIAALVIAAVDYLVQKIFKFDAAPFGRGLSGFIVSVIIIYLSQFLVPGMEVNALGAVIASLIIGVVDAILPVNVM
ncbi:MAG TPA: phage holin family protein [Clostridiales bacterium]|nr:phage holin family protein [Clostridiales bacterium]